MLHYAAPSWVLATLTKNEYTYSASMGTGDKVKVSLTMDAGTATAVNFYDAAGNIVFNFNPRPSWGCVVRNAMYAHARARAHTNPPTCPHTRTHACAHRNVGYWGVEERSGPMPFIAGRSYTIVFERSSSRAQTRPPKNNNIHTHTNARTRAHARTHARARTSARKHTNYHTRRRKGRATGGWLRSTMFATRASTSSRHVRNVPYPCWPGWRSRLVWR